MDKYYFRTAEEIIKAKNFEDFYEICNGCNDFWFHPDEIENFLEMLNYIAEKGSLQKSKEIMAFLEAGSFYAVSPMAQFTGFSLPSRRDVRISSRNVYRLSSVANYNYGRYYDEEKSSIKIVFNGTKWILKSTRIEFKEYYDDALQFRKIYWF